MPLETKGNVKYDPDVKAGDAEYTIECKPLGICEGGSGDLESDIDTLTKKIKAAISEEFHIPLCHVQMTKYTMALTFDVLKEAADRVNAGALSGSGYTVTASVGEKAPKKKKGRGAP
jgi:hypothetical protein